MQYTGLMKRFAPFAVTFIVGIFISNVFSFFIAPSASSESNWKARKVYELREENRRLKREKCRLEWRLRKEKEREFNVMRPAPPPPPIAPKAPKAPQPPAK